MLQKAKKEKEAAELKAKKEKEAAALKAKKDAVAATPTDPLEAENPELGTAYVDVLVQRHAHDIDCCLTQSRVCTCPRSGLFG